MARARSATKRQTYRGVAGLNKALRKLPKEASARLRDASVAIADGVAIEARSRANSGLGGVAKVARFVAPTIKASRDRVPVVRMGGDRLLPPRNGRERAGARSDGVAGPRNPLNQTVGAVMWGAEFGSDRSDQFSPWGGNDTSAGYFLWPSIRGDEIAEEYGKAFDRAMEGAL